MKIPEMDDIFPFKNPHDFVWDFQNETIQRSRGIPMTEIPYGDDPV